MNQHTTAHYGCVHTMKNAKTQQCKKMHYYFDNYKTKKQSNNTGKSSDIKKKCRQNDCMHSIMQFAIKSTYISYNAIANLANGTHQQENIKNETPDRIL